MYSGENIHSYALLSGCLFNIGGHRDEMGLEHKANIFDIFSGVLADNYI